MTRSFPPRVHPAPGRARVPPDDLLEASMALTRRAVLAAGAGIGALGLAGLGADVLAPTAVRRVAGGCRSTAAPAARSIVTRATLRSAAMGGDVAYAVARPASSPT